MIYKVKRKSIGKVLKGGGVSAKLNDNLSQGALAFLYKRFGKEHFTIIKENKVEHDSNTESPSE